MPITKLEAAVTSGNIHAHPLTHARAQRGLTLAALARRVADRSPGMAALAQKIYRWEHGVIPEPAACCPARPR